MTTNAKADWAGLDRYKAGLAFIAQEAKHPRKLMTEAGIFMVNEEIPVLWANSGLKSSGREKGLRASIVTRIGDDTLEIGSPLPYAKVQNRGTGYLPGGAIVPKNGKYLTIPIMDDEEERRTFRARDYHNTFVKESKNGNLMLFQKMKDGSIRALAVLKKQVVIPGRNYLYWRRSALNKIASIWKKIIREEAFR